MPLARPGGAIRNAHSQAASRIPTLPLAQGGASLNLGIYRGGGDGGGGGSGSFNDGSSAGGGEGGLACVAAGAAAGAARSAPAAYAPGGDGYRDDVRRRRSAVLFQRGRASACRMQIANKSDLASCAGEGHSEPTGIGRNRRPAACRLHIATTKKPNAWWFSGTHSRIPPRDSSGLRCRNERHSACTRQTEPAALILAHSASTTNPHIHTSHPAESLSPCNFQI